MTQDELGNKLSPKVAQATISQWEQEKVQPSAEQKAQIRQFLGQANGETGVTNPPDDQVEHDVGSPAAIGNWLNRSRLGAGFSVPELARKSGLSAVSIYNIESGKIENPQSATVRKLEKALGKQLSAEAKEDAKEEATIEGVGEWFDFDPNSESEWPIAAGVYVLYDISNRPIYVGQGQKISSRLRDHHQKFWFRPPIVQLAAYVGIDNKSLREQIEKVLIKFLKTNAVLNQQNVDR